MRDFDLTPMWRSTIGFDRLFDLIDDSFRLQGQDNYPPYNIAKTGEDAIRYVAELAKRTGTELVVTPTVAALATPVYSCGELLTASVAVGVALVITKFPAARPVSVV